jgi:peptide chain release factor 1
MTNQLSEKLKDAKERFDELSTKLSDPDVISNRAEYQKIAREFGELKEILETADRLEKAEKEYSEAMEIAESEDDAELKSLAKAEAESLDKLRRDLDSQLKSLLVPADPNDKRNTIVEIRAGTGGEEAALFAADLFRMYQRYAETQGWKIDVLNSNPTEIGGFKEIIFLVEGKGAYSKFKYESGVHRVQRIPKTESGGRIHTSAVTVAVLPEAEDVEIEIDPQELDVDVFRSSGPGGQSVNTTDSAVRITHKPSGIVVTCQDEKSQHKNKAKALKVLRARLLDRAITEHEAKVAKERKDQVGTGDRSAKIRTYNFPQGRVTDHRIGLTLYNLEGVLEGELEEVITALTVHDAEKRLDQAI